VAAESPTSWISSCRWLQLLWWVTIKFVANDDYRAIHTPIIKRTVTYAHRNALLTYSRYIGTFALTGYLDPNSTASICCTTCCEFVVSVQQIDSSSDLYWHVTLPITCNNNTPAIIRFTNTAGFYAQRPCGCIYLCYDLISATTLLNLHAELS